MLIAVLKMLYILGRGVAGASEERLSQRGTCCRPSPAEQGHLSQAGSNAKQMWGYLAQLMGTGVSRDILVLISQ